MAEAPQSPKAAAAARDRLLAAGLILLALAAWGAAHPYRGVAHDAVLYSMQALAGGAAPQLRGDLFLAFGSQDAYTIFPAVLAAAFDGLGVPMGAKAVAGVGQAAWLVAAYAFLRALAPERTAPALMLLFVAAANPSYGVRAVFSYGEGFATPRLIVEALTLAAFALALRGRVVAAIAVFLVSAAMHPIMAVAGFGVIAFYLALSDARWWLAILAGLAGLGVGAALGVAPLDRLGAIVDPEWRAVLEDRNYYLFPSLWSQFDWFALIVDIFALTGAAAVATGAERRVYLAGALGVAAGVVATWIGVEVLSDLFLLQTQPSRIFWIAHVLALAAAARLFISIWPPASGCGGALRGLALFAFIALALSRLNVLAEFAAGVSLLLLSVCVAVRRNSDGLNVGARAGPAGRAALIGFALLAAALAVFVLRIAILRLGAVDDVISRFAAAPFSLTLAPPAAMLAGAAVWALGARRGGAVAVVAGVSLMAAAWPFWDRRSDWIRFVESGDWSEPASLIGPDEDVFWQPNNGVGPVWFGLRRRSFVTRTQGAGLVFGRETAMAYDARRRVVAPIAPHLAEAYHDAGAGRPPPAAPSVSTQSVAAICGRPDGPQVLALTSPTPGARAWTPPTPLLQIYGAASQADGRNHVTDVIETLYFLRCDEPER